MIGFVLSHSALVFMALFLAGLIVAVGFVVVCGSTSTPDNNKIEPVDDYRYLIGKE